MRQRGRVLRVDTFPFLAVLLCTMGSLILLLMVIDRRAKVVARARAMRVVTQLVEEREDSVRARKQELDRRREVLHASLQKELEGVQKRAAEIHRQVDVSTEETTDTEAAFRELVSRLRSEQAELETKQKDLHGIQAALEQQGQQTSATQAELSRLFTDLVTLEKALTNLKELRQRQQNVFSLVPYRGKYGDNRRPIYLECGVGGVVFHPDRLALDGLLLSEMQIRSEMDKRLVRQRAAMKAAGVTDQGPYLLVLLRPSGIENYYRILAAIEGLKVDFGYELIDEDWVLDFPEDENQPRPPQPWMTSTAPATKAPPPGFRSAPPQPSPLLAQGGLRSFGPGGSETAEPGQAGPGGNGSGGNGRGFGPGASGRGFGPGGSGTGRGPGPGGPGGTTGGAGVAGLDGSGGANGPGGVGPGGTGNGFGPGGSGTSGTGNGFGRGGNGTAGNGARGTGTGYPGGTGSGVGASGRGVPGGTGPGPGGPESDEAEQGVAPPWAMVSTGGGGGKGGVGTLGIGASAGLPSNAGPGSQLAMGGGAGFGGSGAPGAGETVGAGVTGSGSPGGAGANGTGVAGMGPGGSRGGYPGMPGAGTRGMGQSGPGTGVPPGYPGGSSNGPAMGQGPYPGAAGNGPQQNPGAMPGQPGAGSGATGVALGSPQAGPPNASGNGPPLAAGPQGPGTGQGSPGDGSGLPGGTWGADGSSSPGQGGTSGSGGGGSSSSGTAGGDQGGGGASEGGGPANPAQAVAAALNAAMGNRPAKGASGGGSGQKPNTPEDPTSGGGAPPSGGGGTVMGMLSRPEPPDVRRPPSRLAVRYSLNRDWVIPVECNADEILLPTTGQHFSVQEMQSANGQPLQEALRRLIERRQATVREGEPEYRPQVRFLVAPDGLRAYYLAYPALGPLRIPMSREQRDPNEEKKN